MAAGATAILTLCAAGYLYLQRAPKLTAKGTIVLAEFENKTGDAVFDQALRQGLAVQLEQSPFLTLVSDESIQQVPRLMNRPLETRLTPEVAREVCERTASTAVLEGSIASLGNQYVLWLRTWNCRTGEALAEEQAQARTKEEVLNALSRIAIQVRTRLGESLATIQEHSIPLEQATTSSLEALKAYSAARSALFAHGFAPAIPTFSAPSPSTLNSRWRMPIWVFIPGTWAKPIWAPRKPVKPTNCGIASATGRGSTSLCSTTGR